MHNSSLLRSDNGVLFAFRSYTRLTQRYRLCQEFITPHSPWSKGLVERVMLRLKEQYLRWHGSEAIQQTGRMRFYNHPALATGTEDLGEERALTMQAQRVLLGYCSESVGSAPASRSPGPRVPGTGSTRSAFQEHAPSRQLHPE